MSHAPPPWPPEPVPERRTFFTRLVRWGTVALGVLATVALSVPLVGFLFGALFKRKEEWVALGPLDAFPVGRTQSVEFVNPLRQPWDGMTAKANCFVCNLGADDRGRHRFRVLAVNCAHLGCPVSWFPQSGLFMCPCHGGVYYENGERASGPPPRGLYPCVWRVTGRGLEIQAPHLPTLQDTLRKDDRA